MSSEYVVGGLYSICSGDRFKVTKILAVDDEGVHICLYKETFDARPNVTEIPPLTLGKLGDDEFGIAHLPLTRSSFTSAQPLFIAQENILPAELDGYEFWKSGNGGYWNIRL